MDLRDGSLAPAPGTVEGHAPHRPVKLPPIIRHHGARRCGCGARAARGRRAGSDREADRGTHSDGVRADLEDYRSIFDVNVFGTLQLTQAAIPAMKDKGGSIVFVNSMVVRKGGSLQTGYAASKGAVDTLTIGLAQELAAEGIRVNAIRAGVIVTDIHASGGEPGRVERIKSKIPMQRGGTAEEVARAILWLLSDEASYTTGAFLDVSGGR